MKNQPKRDGSGKGTGQNAGRGCNTPTRKNQTNVKRTVKKK